MLHADHIGGSSPPEQKLIPVPMSSSHSGHAKATMCRLGRFRGPVYFVFCSFCSFQEDSIIYLFSPRPVGHPALG